MKQTNSARALKVFNEWYYKNKALDPLFDSDYPTAEQEAEFESMLDAEFKDN